jgi:hypothetical protein
MRTLFVLTAVIILAPLAAARVWTSVYRCDEVTPLAFVAPIDANHPTVYRDIMVGTHLVIVVSSDTVETWSGTLCLSWDDANDVTLSARGFDPESWNYEGSCLEAAGRDAVVFDFVDDNDFGFWYNNDPGTAIPGAWFAFDYYADQIGSVDVMVYGVSGDYLDIPPEVIPMIPLEIISFTHVASRDFSGDGIVNFEDFAVLGKCWRSPLRPEPNNPGGVFDLNTDGQIDLGDMGLFTEYWLERTDCNAPATDPNNSRTIP